jgi:hypothetical protein
MNGLWIVLSVAALFMSLSEYHQQFFYIHFWEHLGVANVVGLGVSAYFFVAGGEEKYARCVTKDQVEGGQLKRPLPPSTPVSEPVRFFLGTLSRALAQ